MDNERENWGLECWNGDCDIGGLDVVRKFCTTVISCPNLNTALLASTLINRISNTYLC